MNENLTLWHSVEKTDPAQTKQITGKAYRGNSPKPHFIVFKATETFGPCGIGWGFDIVEEKLLDGALIDPGFYERIHMARVRVWYEYQGKRGTVEHVGQTLFCGRRKGENGRPGLPFTDEDAPKKSVTDALIKALSLIGFAGDIFMGRFDDSKYVADLKRELAEEAKAKPAQLDDVDEARGQYIDACLRFIAKAPDSAKLKAWWQSDTERQARADFELNDAEMTRLKNALTDRLSEIAKMADDPFAEPDRSRANGRDHGRAAHDGRRAA